MSALIIILTAASSASSTLYWLYLYLFLIFILLYFKLNSIKTHCGLWYLLKRATSTRELLSQFANPSHPLESEVPFSVKCIYLIKSQRYFCTFFTNTFSVLFCETSHDPLPATALFFFKPVSQTRSSTWRTVEKAPINIPRIQVYWAGNHKKRWIVILADCITRLARPLSPSSCSVSSPAQTWRAAVPLPLQSELAARVECEAGMWGYLSWSGESRQHNVSVYAQDTSESGMSFAQVFPRQAAGLQEVLVIL